MHMTEIDAALRQLRLSGMARTLSDRVMQDQAAQEPFLRPWLHSCKINSTSAARD